MEQSKNVLIIGNGFDLALNYRTRYEDFMKFLFHARDLNHDDYVQFIHEEWDLEDFDKTAADNIFNFAKNEIENNFIVKYFVNFHNKTLTWADFETELANIGHCLETIITLLRDNDTILDYSYAELPIKDDLRTYLSYLLFFDHNELFSLDVEYRNRNEQYQRATFSLKNRKRDVDYRIQIEMFIKELPTLFLDKLLKFCKLFEDYLRVESSRNKQIIKTDYSFENIITYNYTDFCSSLCENVFHVNGEISKSTDEVGIIFGVDSNLNFKTNAFSQITKKIQRPAQGIKTNKISTICKGANLILIFGYSLTTADKDSLKLALQQMRSRIDQRKIIIFYKSSGSLKQDRLTKSNLTNNLRIILDDMFDELIDLVEFRDSNDFFNHH